MSTCVTCFSCDEPWETDATMRTCWLYSCQNARADQSPTQNKTCWWIIQPPAIVHEDYDMHKKRFWLQVLIRKAFAESSQTSGTTKSPGLYSTWFNIKPNVSFTINMMYIWVTWAHPHSQTHLPGPSTQALVHLHLDLMVSQEFTRRKYLSGWISCIPIHLINMDPARKPWKDSYQCPLDLFQTSNVKAMILNEIIRSMVKKKGGMWYGHPSHHANH